MYILYCYSVPLMHIITATKTVTVELMVAGIISFQKEGPLLDILTVVLTVGISVVVSTGGDILSIVVSVVVAEVTDILSSVVSAVTASLSVDVSAASDILIVAEVTDGRSSSEVEAEETRGKVTTRPERKTTFRATFIADRWSTTSIS